MERKIKSPTIPCPEKSHAAPGLGSSAPSLTFLTPSGAGPALTSRALSYERSRFRPERAAAQLISYQRVFATPEKFKGLREFLSS